MEAIILELLACQPYDFALGTSILTLNNVWFQRVGTLLYLTSQFLTTVLHVSLCKMWQLHKPDYYTSWLFQSPILIFTFGKFILLLLALWCVVLALGFFHKLVQALIMTKRNKWSIKISILTRLSSLILDSMDDHICFYFNHVKLDGTWWCRCHRNQKTLTQEYFENTILFSSLVLYYFSLKTIVAS